MTCEHIKPAVEPAFFLDEGKLADGYEEWKRDTVAWANYHEQHGHEYEPCVCCAACRHCPRGPKRSIHDKANRGVCFAAHLPGGGPNL